MNFYRFFRFLRWQFEIKIAVWKWTTAEVDKAFDEERRQWLTSTK